MNSPTLKIREDPSEGQQRLNKHRNESVVLWVPGEVNLTRTTTRITSFAGIFEAAHFTESPRNDNPVLTSKLPFLTLEVCIWGKLGCRCFDNSSSMVLSVGGSPPFSSGCVVGIGCCVCSYSSPG